MCIMYTEISGYQKRLFKGLRVVFLALDINHRES